MSGHEYRLPTLEGPTPPATQAPQPRAPHPDKALLTAWLLLLLSDGESYGWALFAALRERGISVEQSLAYRDLRELERDGLVTSRWTKSDAGPQRRSYRITRKGRRALADLAASVTAAWELHEAFVRAHTAAGDEHDGRSEAERSPVDEGAEQEEAAARPGRELLAAWLLLLLQGSVSYGYELRHELDAHAIHIDPATLYRLLRKLEASGWLESRWMNPSAGPRRRLYRVTPRGRRNLDDLAAVITRDRDAHGAFLRAYDASAGAEGAKPGKAV